jgi:hypothetical protein
VAIARENWFLGHQIPREGIRYSIKRYFGELSKQTDAYRLVDFLYTGEFKRNNDGYWRWLREKSDKEKFLHKVLNAPDLNDRRIFLIMLELFGEWFQRLRGDRFKDIMLGEKTPSHIYYVPTILEWFPNSRIIHTFRDPRAIFASELRRRRLRPSSFPYNKLYRTRPLFFLFILLQVTYAWYRAIKLHFKYEKLYLDRYRLLQFEQLIANPEKCVRELCSFLCIDFNYEMLEVKVGSDGFKYGQSGFDRDAPERWKHVNPSWVNRWFSSWASVYLNRLKG